MNDTLSGLERTLYRAVVDDGVWDAVLGAWMLAIGVSIATGVPMVGNIIAGAAFPIGFMLGKRTARRAGYVQFAPARVRRLRRARIVVPAVALVLLVALLVTGTHLPGLVKAAIFLAAVVSVAAHLFDIARFHAYAIVILVAAAGVLAVGVRWELALVAAGVAILASGLVVLTRFLRRYPVSMESSHD